ncbi:GFA family protein [Celeribacter sp. PS-C1]|uniref:GFA family protein n=1 Tax=Celeribacter sp. PS-C1 TaxID=2820813 RepID=UPI001C67E992|nr:GFA family protein [Celeribacter sp. PS-C1]MBW6417344.1 GFA family protein [Celeribacter sp. PS-C1]
MPDKILSKIGNCRCGAVEIEVSQAPVMTAACHCTGCQKMSASAFSLTAMVPAEGFRVAKGEVVKGGAKGPDLDHYCCPNCMTWMFTRITGFDALVNIRPTLFDLSDSDVMGWATPFIETMLANKLPWADTPAPHKFDAMPEMDSFPTLLAAFAQRAL